MFLLFLARRPILSPNRNKRAKMLFKEVEAGRKMK
jgi:hypothetical protein